ncbi:coronin-2B-like isoform X2 [Liolophura sinensis]|uniref:coronin-2B-like isoform X2 n=1 Tax=Liolophura sinensis TaxID=3198878 RepID=UPI0031589BDB
MPMSFRMRSSKFRHVFGNSTRKDHCYEGIKISKHGHDSNQSAVNPLFLAVCTESAGGGSFVVLPLERTGRVDINTPKVCGHKGPVLDVKWNPFNDHVIASCSEDATVKVWQIPHEGLRTNLTDWSVDLHGHQRRVGYIEWHPTAENIVLSAGLDFKCIIWNVEQAEPVNIMNCHPDTVFSLCWNRDGSLFATTCKDKKIRVVDPRAGYVAIEGQGHQGPKATKVVMLGNSLSNHLYTTGFSRTSERQHAIWDIRSFGKPLKMETVDYSNGVMTPFYDFDTGVVFLAGKGDGNIRYYEVVPTEPYYHFLNQYQSSTPQRSVCAMPKRGCDAHKNEIMRFYKLYADKSIVEPISMIVPRRAETFQEDIFPPTASSTPSLTADEWISGLNRNPILISLQDGHVTNTPQTSASVAVQKQDGALFHAPTITTYKAVNKSVNGSHYPEAKVPKKSATVPPFEGTTVTVTASLAPSQRTMPASIKNIQRLSTHESIEETSSETSSSDNVNDMITAFERRWRRPPDNIDVGQSSNIKRGWSQENSITSNGAGSQEVEFQGSTPPTPLTPMSLLNSLMDVDYSPKTNKFFPGQVNTTTKSLPNIMEANNNNNNWLSTSLERQTSYGKPLSSQNSLDNSSSQASINLKKAYFRQVEEIRSLKEQLSVKDKRIRQLEEELTLIKDMQCGPGESNC